MSIGFTKPVIGVIVLVAIFAGYILVNAGGFLLSTSGTKFFEGCTWQEDYWFISCVSVPGQEVILEDQPKQSILGYGFRFTCPVGADVHECKIESTNQDVLLDAASCGGFDCSDKQNIGSGSVIAPGRIIATADGTFGKKTVIRVYRKELRSTGLAGTGFGESVSGAQGCSWNSQNKNAVAEVIEDITGVDIDGDELRPATSNDVIDTVGVGKSFRFVYSQHLISCPQNCAPGVDDLSCSVPSSLKSGTTTYQGKQVKWYGSGVGINIVGCKGKQQCQKYNEDNSRCLEYTDNGYGQCGTLAQLQAGQCVQNSDCGDTTRYACDFDSAALKGTCKTIDQAPTQECSTDFDCSQTGATCNAKQLGGSVCRSGQCVVEATPVQCCTSSDCSTGFFCNSDYACQDSENQKPDPPAGECSEGNPFYRDRTCSDMTGGVQTVCCDDGSCASTEDECGEGNQPSPFTCVAENGILTGSNNQCCEGLVPIQENFLGPTTCGKEEIDVPMTAIFAGLMGLLAAILAAGRGQKKKWALGAVVGAITAIVVYAVLTFIFQQWWLILIGGLAGGALLIYLAPGLVSAILVLALLLKK